MASLFTVVLPTHNRAAMLRSALASVRAQTCGDWECFVLDDGSTDPTPAVFDEFRSDARFKLHRFEDNRRQHVRRNFAIARAAGRFIAFLDSDDIWLPDRLAAFAAAIAARPGTAFWFSNAYLLRWGRVVGTVFDPKRPVEEGVVPGWHAVGDEFLPYLTSNLAVSKKALEAVGPFREDLTILEDTELYARLLGLGFPVGVLRKPLAVRRLHPDQITHDHSADFAESLLALKSGGAPEEVAARKRRELALAAAENLWKALRPAEARAFLLKELGEEGRKAGLYPLTFVPAPLLGLAKAARACALKLRHHPLWAPADLRPVYAFLRPLLDRELASGAKAP